MVVRISTVSMILKSASSKTGHHFLGWNPFTRITGRGMNACMSVEIIRDVHSSTASKVGVGRQRRQI
jgi:hypothetical protein